MTKTKQPVKITIKHPASLAWASVMKTWHDELETIIKALIITMLIYIPANNANGPGDQPVKAYNISPCHDCKDQLVLLI